MLTNFTHLLCLTLLAVSAHSFGLEVERLLRRQVVAIGTGPTTAAITSPTEFPPSVTASSITTQASSGSLFPSSSFAPTTPTPGTSSSSAALVSNFSPTSIRITSGVSVESSSRQPQTTRTGSVTQQIVTTIVSISGSSTFSSVQTSNTIVAAASATSLPPELSGSNNGEGNSGLSSNSKKIIGGVVGGVGGAILLGALAIVAWRVWGRKRNYRTDDNDDVVDTAPSSSGKEKRSSAADPFRANLDQTHAPLNTASNF